MSNGAVSIPRLRAHHLLGHLPALRHDALALQRRIASEGDVVRTRLGAMDLVWVSSPATLTEVLVERAEDYEKSPGLTVLLRPLIGDGILSSQGSRYKRRRAIVAPAFQAGRIARYADAIVQQTDHMLADLATYREVDLGQQMMRLTLEVVGDTLFHTRVRDDILRVGEATAEGSEAVTNMLRWPLPLPPSPIFPSARRLLRVTRELDSVVYRIIGERRASGEDPGDVLSMLLSARDEAGEALSDEELRDEVMTLFLAGHETTANALTWTLQLLACHPEVLRRLEREVDQVLAGRAPAYADLSALPYTACVFKEAMRLYPPAYLVGRRALTETRIGRFRIPRGALVFCNIYGVQRRAELFPEPDAFRPERFSDGAEKRWPRGAYLPFSLGPRVCVGNHFALMEGQLVIARMVQRLSLEGVIDRVSETEPLVTLRPLGRVRMRVVPRAASDVRKSA